ncbi:MAG: glycosyltransferase family 4 protein [Parvularculaceae bacterium]
MSEKLNIVFVLAANSISPTGGFRIIAGYADRLQARGHQVTLIAPGGVRKRPHSLRARVMELLYRVTRPRREGTPFLKNPGVRVVTVPGVDKLAPEHFPQADVLIATWWETAEWIAPAPGAVKLHFVQGHEAFPYLPLERVRAVYRMPSPKIVVSQWLQSKMAEYGGGDCVIVENAVDMAEFSRGEGKKPARPTVGFAYSLATVKNSALAIEACRRLRALYPDLRVVAFGSHRPRASDNMPPWIEYSVYPSADKIAELYGACDAWLFTSDEEGYGLPILEAMAAGTPVVATPAGAAPQLVTGENGALVEHDSADIAAAAARIVNSSSEDWAAMSRAAAATARAHNWDAATDQFEAALRAALPPQNR